MSQFKITLGIMLLAVLLLPACNNTVQDGPPLHSVDVSHIPNATPQYEPKSRYGNPHSYVALGRRYFTLASAHGYDKKGIASWYGRKFHGQLTSSREPYNMFAMTGASPVLPIPSYVRVTNLENNRSVVVRINDRGPFAVHRIIDLSYAAAKKLGYIHKGTALVDVRAIDINPLHLLKRHHYTPRLYLQAGAFSSYINAVHLKKRLSNYINKPIHIIKSNAHHLIVYKIHIGPLTKVSEFYQLSHTLRQYGLHHVIKVIY